MTPPRRPLRECLRISLRALCLLGILPVAGPEFPPAFAASSPERPRLVVMLVIDQGRAEYLERFASEFQGGLARLRREGVTFLDAHQDHAVTATAPGHATLSTGAYPRTSGIVGNEWFEDDGRRRVYCVDDASTRLVTSAGESDSEGRSPRNLLVTALADWLKQAQPGSRAFTASRKDRAAVLLGGHHADAAYWYDAGTGEFVSSTYYLSELPEWARAFNAAGLPATRFGGLWEPLEEIRDPAGLQVTPADRGWFTRRFPYALGDASLAPDRDFYASFGETPFMDEYLLEFVDSLVRGERLGGGEATDFLGVSLSALDSVGHTFGPNSPEIVDEFLRMDRALGRFFERLDEAVGRGRYWVVFSADHGAMELPEYRQHLGLPAGRLGALDIQCIQRRGLEFLKRYGAEEDWFLSGFYLNYAAVGRTNRRRGEVERDAAALLEQCGFIRKVWTRTELEAPDPAAGELEAFRRLFRNSYLAGRSPDLLVQTQEYFLTATGTGTSHGTPYRYDTHVPLVFLVPGLAPARHQDRVATVDVAPTLAELLGIPVPQTVDGRSLASLPGF